ncbi:hypothetical protein [Haloechinothrix salitolerans]|uniref:Uncharacterized protein n=1 Tax=Haloechinothrix salitolerans TaxID=926830 RepID=A0ABW2BTM4_9PSEU
MTNPEEELAEQIVTRALDGAVIQRDENSGHSEVDLIVDATDGRRIAIEITQLTSADFLRLQDHFKKYLTGPIDTLSYTWIVRFTETINIKQNAESIITLLRNLEQAGIYNLRENAQQPPGSEGHDKEVYVRQLRNLALLEVYAVAGPGWILYANTTVGTSNATGEILSTIVSDVVNDPDRNDNAIKLRSSSLDHRHLFIWVGNPSEPVRHAVEQALRSEFLPTTPPSVPSDYTGAWIAVSGNSPIALWERDAGWQTISPS